MYKRIVLRSAKDVRRRCHACSTANTSTARTSLALAPYRLQWWTSESFSGSRYSRARSALHIRCFSTSPGDKKNRIELSGRSLLFSLPVIDDDESSDDEEDGTYAIGRPMFSDKMSSLANLKAHYLNEHDIKLTPSDFNCTKVSYKREGTGSILHAWTCFFTCPLTGNVYSSGRLRQLFSALDEEDVPDTYQQTVLYSKRRGAEHAAAARALDAIQYQKTGLTEPRFCEEDPVTSNGAKQPTLSSDATAKPLPSEPVPPTLDLQSPASYYFEKHGIKLTADNYVTDSMSYHEPDRKSASVLWTSVFTCPVSGQQYVSGTVEGDDDLVDVDQDRVFYRKKIGAERAASRRAFDVIRFETFGILEPRFCREDPSGHKEERVVEETKPNATESSHLIQQPREKKTASKSTASANESLSSSAGTPILALEPASSAPNDDDASSVDSIEPDETDDEDEYIVSHISHSIGYPPSQRLLQVASQVAGSGSAPKVAAVAAAAYLPAHGSQTRSAVDVANAWLASILNASASNSAEKGNPHRLSLPRNNADTILVCGKTILASLAAVSQACPVGQNADIEPLAKKVIDTLWRTDKSKPDTDTYTLYLKCLDGGNPKAAVEKAETIVEAMVSKVKHKSTGSELPQPNQHTFNALIQISAQIGGTSGRIAKLTDQAFAPDRESFLAVLSSSVYRPAEEFESGIFDPTFAKECIQRMSQLAVETSNPFFLPDTQVYNAPLRWSGGPSLWMKSRPYARYVPWDSYESIYAKGLRANVDNNDLRIQEARELEEWLNMMQEASLTNSRVAPDIETYEAAIQGWLRTATREGLDRAEALLRRLLQSNSTAGPVQPRLQTFHPIIAAWYHSQHAEFPTKSLELIQLWEDSCSSSGSQLDIRMIEMKMIACLNVQRSRLNEASHETRSAIVDAAYQCSAVLKAACDQFDEEGAENEPNAQPIPVKLFADVVRAWENGHAERVDDIPCVETNLTLSEMTKVFALFERLLQSTVSHDTGHGVLLRGQDFSMLLEHLVLNSQTLFGCLVDALMSVGRKEDVAESLLLIEKMTRMVGEFDEIESHCFQTSEPDRGQKSTSSYFSFGRRPLPDDDFCYQIKGDGRFPISRHAFLWKVVRFMEQMSVDTACQSDIVRLATLVKRIGSSRRSSSKMDEAIDQILDRGTVPSQRLATVIPFDNVATTALPLSPTDKPRRKLSPSVSPVRPRERKRRGKKMNGS